MSNILFVKANDRPADQAVSVKLYDAFLSAYKESHPGDTVTELDLYNTEFPFYGNTAITGTYKAANGFELTADEQKQLHLQHNCKINSWQLTKLYLHSHCGTSLFQLHW